MARYVPPGHAGDSLIYPDATVGDVLRGAAARFADRPALRDGGLVVTYAELFDNASRIAAGLRERGVRVGETVALHLPNSAWFTTCYYGILIAGAVVTPINPTLPPAVVREQLEDAEAVALVSHPVTLPPVRSSLPQQVRLLVTVPGTAAAPAPPVEAVDGAAPSAARVTVEELLRAQPLSSDQSGVGPGDLAHLSFTGGTTGRSKAVEVTHRNVVANALQCACFRGGTEPVVCADGAVTLRTIPEAQTPQMSPLGEGRSVALAPLFHAMGLISQNVNVLGGAEVIVVGRFDPVELLDLIEKERISGLPGSPALFHALLAVPGIEQRDLSSVVAVNSGAAPIEPVTLERLAVLFPNAQILEGYGLTEATMAVTLHPMAGPGVVPTGSVGAPIFDTELSIRSLADHQEVPVGDVGEVWVRGPQVTRGYHGHPELTKEQYVDGWLRTGDLGRVDEDGWLFLVGRAKDMLIYKGYNVYPSPLETILVEHPAVAQASVVGAPVPEVGEIPVAFVVLAADHRATPDLGEALMAHVAARVAPYARVREVIFVDALPTSAAGKVLKTALRDQLVSTSARGGHGG